MGTTCCHRGESWKNRFLWSEWDSRVGGISQILPVALLELFLELSTYRGVFVFFSYAHWIRTHGVMIAPKRVRRRNCANCSQCQTKRQFNSMGSSRGEPAGEPLSRWIMPSDPIKCWNVNNLSPDGPGVRSYVTCHYYVGRYAHVFSFRLRQQTTNVKRRLACMLIWSRINISRLCFIPYKCYLQIFWALISIGLLRGSRSCLLDRRELYERSWGKLWFDIQWPERRGLLQTLGRDIAGEARTKTRVNLNKLAITTATGPFLHPSSKINRLWNGQYE